MPVGCRVAILGLPDDLGVKLNNGRPGAGEGPAAFRAALAKYGVAEPAGFDWPRVFDAGDVTPASGSDADALAETHSRVSEAAETLAKEGMTVVGIGGGHDLTFALVRGVINALGPLEGIYFDPHLDVRAEAGSGMPFRRLIETCGVKRLTIHGFNPLVNAKEHTNWFLQHGGILADVWVTPSRAAIPRNPCFASFDMDVLDAAHAPGVSALNPCGWTVERGAAWAHAAGQSTSVRCFDIMELSPKHDDQGRTARVAAHLFLSFLRGWSERPQERARPGDVTSSPPSGTTR